jgi:hypothetical protein
MIEWECLACGKKAKVPSKSVRVFCSCGQPPNEVLIACRSCWHALHNYSQTEWNPIVACKWFDSWMQTIPTYGCGCRRHWKEIVNTMPPDFSTLETFQSWAIDAHNQVNRKLGKPIWKKDI